MTQKRKIKPWLEFKRFVSLPVRLLNLFIRPVSKRNAIFCMPRLAGFNSVFIDKFTDPVLDNSVMKEDSVVFQKEVKGIYYGSNRYQSDRVVSIEGLWVWIALLGIVASPISFFILGGKLWKLYNKGKKVMGLSPTFYPKSLILLTMSFIEVNLWRRVFNRIGFTNLFVVNRDAHMLPLIAAKLNGMQVFEFQHGATLTNTVLYSPPYHTIVDPNYFLVFGEKWRGPQFGISEEKIINIGWALPKLLTRLQGDVALREDNSVLIISAPHSTNILFKLVVDMATTHTAVNFYIRLHPQEGYNAEQVAIIESIDNLNFDDKSIDSSKAVLRCPKVLGVFSTVLFEALEYNKPVGIVAYGGVETNSSFEGVEEFSKIRNLEDAEEFLFQKKNENDDHTISSGYYDSFNPSILENKLKK